MDGVIAQAAIPRWAAAVEPAGPFQGGGFVEQQWLVRRGEQFLQVSELLYRVVELADGTRTLEDVAHTLTATTEWEVRAEDVALILDRKLAPLGLLEGADGSTPPARRAASPLLVNSRLRVVGPRSIDRAARVLQHLYHAPVVVSLLIAVAAAHIGMFLAGHPGSAMRDLVGQPLSVLPLTGMLLVAGVVHELGHAAALRYGGGRARGIGLGLYVAIPVFYTDVTESYRLSRRARIRTDLGGLYFHLLVASALIVAYAWTGIGVLLVGAFLLDVDVARQLIPFIRLDGYWALADLTGIPDLFTHALPRLLRRVGTDPGGPQLPALRPNIKRIFAAYVALALPAIVGLFGYMAWHAPSVVRRASAGLGQRAELLTHAVARGDVPNAAVAIVEMLLLALPIAGIIGFALVVTRGLSGLPAKRRAAKARSGTGRRQAEPKGALSEQEVSLADAIAQHLELKRRHIEEDRARRLVGVAPGRDQVAVAVFTRSR